MPLTIGIIARMCLILRLRPILKATKSAIILFFMIQFPVLLSSQNAQRPRFKQSTIRKVEIRALK